MTARLADLLDRLGGVPPHRVHTHPPPGTATEADVIRAADRHDIVCELIDGTLVEKAMGQTSNRLGFYLGSLINLFVVRHNLGYVTGEAGGARMASGNVRMPAVAFYSWGRLPGRVQPDRAFADIAPDLAVEVLSPSNTPAEMRRKRDELFAASTRVVWVVDPDDRTVAVYTRPDAPGATLGVADALAGDPVLPGFALPLADLFGELDRRG